LGLSGMRKRKTLEEKFWPKVKKGPGCWEWIGVRDGCGYGRLAVYRESKRVRVFLAHRLSWALNRGAIPRGLCVLHKCDNPPCVRPSHLWVGTQAENNADRDAKGRHWSVVKPDSAPRGDAHWMRTRPDDVLRGECHGRAKLKERDVVKIKKLRTDGVPVKDLVKRFGVSSSTIYFILSGETWAHIGGSTE